MSKRKSKYKPKYKGVRYIAKALNKYQKGKYPTYSSALPDARKFNSDIKSNDKKVKLSNIWELSRTKRKGSASKSSKASSSVAPLVDKNLLDYSFFFELQDYPTWIARCPNDVYFISKITPDSAFDIQGGSVISYEEYFAPYVNFVNGMKALTMPEENRYETDWLVMCTEPILNKVNKRWESKIISIDSDGKEFDYGFDSKTPSLLATKAKLSGVSKPEPVEPEPVITPSSVVSSGEGRVKEIRGLISDLRQDAKDGLISKEDYSKMVKELTSKLETGGSI
jgi:hypothetical protein